MKKIVIVIALAALSAATMLQAQELKDSTAHGTALERISKKMDGAEMTAIDTWQPDDASLSMQPVRPSVTMSSTVKLENPNLPRRVVVLDNNTLRIWRVNVSNGQASNWGGFPNSYLDARTLSFPAPGALRAR